MKILLVSLSNVGGGASRVVNNLYLYLVKRGINVSLLTYEGENVYDNEILNEKFTTKFLFKIRNMIVKLVLSFIKNSSNDYQSLNIFPTILLNKINNSDADIVHLHWIGAEMISIKQLSKINKKIIWTLHDAWAFNGIYHINPLDYDIHTMMDDYGKRITFNFLDRFTLKQKIKYLSNKEINFTAPSNWMKEKYSVSFYNKNVTSCTLIPNFIDLLNWKPIDKKESRIKLNIKTNKNILLYISNNITSYNKGFQFLVKLINELPKKDFMLLIVGGGTIETNLIFPKDFDVIFLGHIKSTEQLKFVYSSADLLVFPSMSENFPLTCIESISCNTPVLAFESSGIKDIVTHKVNGFLCKKFDIKDLLEGVHWLLNNKLNNIRETVYKFDTESIIEQYIDLYKLVNNKK